MCNVLCEKQEVEHQIYVFFVEVMFSNMLSVGQEQVLWVLIADVLLCNVLWNGQGQAKQRYILVVDIMLCSVLCVGKEKEEQP